MFSWYPVLFVGFVVDYISHPVIDSFTTAAAITIACSQLKVLAWFHYMCLLNDTHTHPFNGPFSDLDFTEARDSEWQWHQLDHMQVCISLQTDNHASTPPLKFFTGRMPFLPPNQQRQSTEGNMWTLVRQQWCRDVCSMNMNVIIELISRLGEWLDFTSTLKYWAHCT